MKRFSCILALFLILGLLLSVGCRRDLRYDTPVDGLLEIALQWPDGITKPENVKYAFYEASGKLFREYDKLGGETLRETLPEGTYRVIIYNTDANNVSYRGMDSYSTAEVFVDDVVGKASLSRSVVEPGRVFAVGKCEEFEQLTVKQNDTIVTRAKPVSLTKRISLKFSVTNVSDVVSVSGSLSGVAEGVFLSTGKSNLESNRTALFSGQSQDEANQTFVANMEVFDIVTTDQSDLNTNTIKVLIERSEAHHDANIDITQVVKDLIKDNGGTIPIDIPVEVIFKIVDLELTATVKPWDRSGTGGGDPRPKTSKK